MTTGLTMKCGRRLQENSERKFGQSETRPGRFAVGADLVRQIHLPPRLVVRGRRGPALSLPKGSLPLHCRACTDVKSLTPKNKPQQSSLMWVDKLWPWAQVRLGAAIPIL